MPDASTATGAEVTTFVDTNVLVCAHDASDPIKHRRAREALARLWDTRAGVLSTQVLQEFYVVATAQHKLAMRPAEAREVVELYSAWPVVLLEPSLILTASRLHEQRSISLWDALIVEAARVAGAVRILSEHLRAGEDFDGIQVVDPFAPPTPV
jgi:predicted nucleic acid-binding protein